MKHLKKLTALVLAVCMLIGMPLSLDAGATGRPDSSDYTMPFQLAQAMLVPEEWNTGLDPERSIALYFTGDVTIDLDNTKAYITLVNDNGLASYVDPATGSRTGSIISVWDATISQSTALGTVNNYVVTLNASQSRNAHEKADTIPEILALAESTGLHPYVRLREVSDKIVINTSTGTTAQRVNGQVGSIYEGTTYLTSTPNGEDGGGCNAVGQVIDTVGTDASDEDKANGQITNCYDYVDATITTIDDAPAVNYVEYDPSVTSGNNFRIILSTGISYGYRGSSHVPVHMRVVNSKGQVIYTNGSSYVTEDQATSGYYALGNYNNAASNIHGLNLEQMISQSATLMTHALNAVPRKSWDNITTTDTLDWTDTYNTCVTARDTLNAANDGETYTVAFVMDENDSSADYDGDYVYSTNGESANNWRIDALWATGTYVPMTATHNNAALGINDRVIVPILTPDEMGEAALANNTQLTLKKVSVVSSPGYADRVVIEFSKPVSTFSPSYSGIRVYAPEYVPTHSGTHMQWQTGSWAKYNASGTQWIGTLSTVFNCNTLTEIQSWLVNNGYATKTDGTFAMSGDRRLEFSIADNSADTQNNRLVDRITAADGSVLFANDSPFGTSEERAGVTWDKIESYDFVHIESVKLYADKYVLIDFDRDVTLNTSVFYDALCVYDRTGGNLAGCNADQTEYGLYTLGTPFQKEFTAFTHYGNRKDIVIATMGDGHYAWLCEQMDAANTWSVNNGGASNRFYLRLRLQDLPAALPVNIDYAIDGIAAADNSYGYLRTANSGEYSTLYYNPTIGDKKVVDMTDATLISDNQAVISFSTEIRAVDPGAITLVSADGSKTYPATKADISGTAVTVTFANPVYDEGMGVRISGGGDYMIDASVITTVDGSVILANETASSAYIDVNISDAVAAVKRNDIPYIHFENAWAAKQAGDTLTLYKDVSVSYNMMALSAGVTLDLNGHKLTSDNLIAFGNVVDSTNGDGLLHIDKNDPASFTLLQQENTFLPLYDPAKAGYRFFTYDIINRGTRTVTTDSTVTALKYGIKIDFANTDAYKLLGNAANADVELTFDLIIRLPHSSTRTLIYTLPNWALSSYASAVLDGTGNTLVLKVGGINEVADMVSSMPISATIEGNSSITSGTGVTHDSTKEIYQVGITPAQAAVNWINEQISNNSLVSFTYGGVAFPTNWTKTDSGAGSATSDWTRTVTYTNTTDGTLKLTLTITFDASHAALDWVGNWSFTRASSSNPYSSAIKDIRILDAAFTVNGAVMTTANQGGQNYIYDYQPYSIDLPTTTTYTMDNVGGRSSQGGWPYFDLTSKHNTYGIMGAIGWSGNWNCTFTYNDAGTVNVSAGMQNTNYMMKTGESLRTPSMVIQFFKGNRDDGHNDWRQLVLENYTPNDVNGDPVRYAPITINTWGGRGTDALLNTMDQVKSVGQYFEYQWIDAGWYGDYISQNTYAEEWKTQRGNWYYNPGYSDASGNVTDPANSLYLTQGGFDAIKNWHAENGTGFLVWFEPGLGTDTSKMGTSASASDPYTFEATYKDPDTGSTVTKTVSWNNSYFLPGTAVVDYGEAGALTFIKAVVLHYLDDMGCYFYRQDYNFNPADGWVSEDASEVSGSLSTRTGVAEILYVTGHYDLLDTIVASGRQIDNCASGGRLLDIEMAKRAIPLWRTDYTVSGQETATVASGVRSQGANLAWWLPISGGMGTSEGTGTEYGFRSYMASGATMGKFGNQTFATKMINEMLTNREMMMGDYYILQQGLHEGLYQDTSNGFWMESDASKDYTDTTDAAYEFYLEAQGKGYLVTFRPNYSTQTTQTYKLKGLDAHADYLVKDADTGETSVYTGRFLMENGIKVVSSTPRTSHMIYFTKQ